MCLSKHPAVNVFLTLSRYCTVQAKEACIICQKLKNCDDWFVHCFLCGRIGDETQRLRDLHVQAARILGEPFREDPTYDFRGPTVLVRFWFAC